MKKALDLVKINRKFIIVLITSLLIFTALFFTCIWFCENEKVILIPAYDSKYVDINASDIWNITSDDIYYIGESNNSVKRLYAFFDPTFIVNNTIISIELEMKYKSTQDTFIEVYPVVLNDDNSVEIVGNLVNCFCTKSPKQKYYYYDITNIIKDMISNGYNTIMIKAQDETDTVSIAFNEIPRLRIDYIQKSK